MSQGDVCRIGPEQEARLEPAGLLALAQTAVERAEETGEVVEIDLRGLDLSHLDFGGLRREWSRLIFGRADSGIPTRLSGAGFHAAHLEWCEFVDVDLDHVSFRGATVVDCDFRYATFQRTQLADAEFRRCDLYGANLCRGTELQRARFELISPPDYYDGVTGLRWSAFERRSPPAIIAESADEYETFLRRTEKERPAGRTLRDAVADRHENAANSYRTLSAYWDSRGQYGDASKAYAHSQRLRRRSLSPLQRDAPTDVVRWVGLWLSDIVCGFGDGLWQVATVLACIAVLPGLVFYALGDVHGSGGLGDDLLFSVAHLTPADPKGLVAANRGAEIVGIGQTIAGLALLGLFGFVLGNRIRRS